MKAILIIMDGLGDRPIKEFGGKTPLEAAKKPNLDRLTARGITGMMQTIGPGITPGSDTSHLAIFGLDPEKHYHGRGPIEACGAGIELRHGDIAFRGNAGTVDEKFIVKDRRAGRIDSTVELCKEIDGMKIDGVEIILKPGAWYRAALVLRGSGLSDKITGNDPKDVNVPLMQVKPTDSSKEAKKTADVLNKLSRITYEKWNGHPYNKKRAAEGKLPGNILLFRAAGQYVPVPTIEDRYHIKSACITGGGLYDGIGRFLGMDVIRAPGATGSYTSDFASKVRTAKAALKDHDFIFIHMKPTDSAGEDGNPKLKKEMVEKMDAAIGGLLDFDGLIVVTADHSTPCELKGHSYEPTPLLMAGPGIRTDIVKEFGERACAKGDLGIIHGLDLMPIITNHMGLAKKYGA
jgi:2,3-bisphosphoglycerate-independent phosphoglycerate mutase